MRNNNAYFYIYENVSLYCKLYCLMYSSMNTGNGSICNSSSNLTYLFYTNISSCIYTSNCGLLVFIDRDISISSFSSVYKEVLGIEPAYTKIPHPLSSICFILLSFKSKISNASICSFPYTACKRVSKQTSIFLLQIFSF